MSLRLVLLALVMVLLASAPAGAATSSRLALHPTGVEGRVLADGEGRLAVIAYPSTAVTVIDPTRGVAARMFAPPRDGCAPTDFHHGELLWVCRNPTLSISRRTCFQGS